MKNVVLVVLLAAAATAAVVGYEDPDMVEMPDVAEEPELSAVTSRGSISLGTTHGRLEYDQLHKADGVPMRVVEEEIRISITGSRITGIRVNRLGESQNATPYTLLGGMGNSFVVIRIRSARGKGFNYRVRVYSD